MAIDNTKREGVIWVCPACGKWSDTELGLWDKDVSCGMYAIPAYKDSTEFGEDGLVTTLGEVVQSLYDNKDLGHGKYGM